MRAFAFSTIRRRTSQDQCPDEAGRNGQAYDDETAPGRAPRVRDRLPGSGGRVHRERRDVAAHARGSVNLLLYRRHLDRLVRRSERLFGNLGRLGRWRQTADYQVNRGDVNHRFACSWVKLGVFAHSPVAAQPTERTLNNPATERYMKFFGIVVAFHDL